MMLHAINSGIIKLHAINSGIIKLTKLTPACTVHRCVAGGDILAQINHSSHHTPLTPPRLEHRRQLRLHRHHSHKQPRPAPHQGADQLPRCHHVRHTINAPRVVVVDIEGHSTVHHRTPQRHRMAHTTRWRG